MMKFISYKNWLNEHTKSNLITYFEQVAQITQGKQKDFWKWKIDNAQLLTHVKTDDIRKQYPKIDIYLKSKHLSIVQKECYKNAGKLCMYVNGVSYIEGEISYHGIPIAHAWNKIDDKYFDITKDVLFPKDSDYAEYVKIIELSQDEYSKFILKYKHWGGFIIEQYMKEQNKKEYEIHQV